MIVYSRQFQVLAWLVILTVVATTTVFMVRQLDTSFDVHVTRSIKIDPDHSKSAESQNIWRAIANSPAKNVAVITTDDDGSYLIHLTDANIQKIGIRCSGNSTAWSNTGEFFVGRHSKRPGDVGPLQLYSLQKKQVVAETDDTWTNDIAWLNETVFISATHFPSGDVDGFHTPSVYRVNDMGEQGIDLQREISVNVSSYSDQVEVTDLTGVPLLLVNSTPPTIWTTVGDHDLRGWRQTLELRKIWSRGTFCLARYGGRGVVVWYKLNGSASETGEAQSRNKLISAFEITLDSGSGNFGFIDLWTHDLGIDTEWSHLKGLGTIAVTADGSYCAIIERSEMKLFDMKNGTSPAEYSGGFVGVSVSSDSSEVTLLSDDGRVLVVAWD